MSIFSNNIDNIIESLQISDVTENIDKKKTRSLNTNSHSVEFKNIEFRSQKYKNSQVLKREKQKIADKEKVKEYLENDKLNVFKRPWNKLETGLKKNRILMFIEIEQSNRMLTNTNKLMLKEILYGALKNNKLNKNEIQYNDQEGVIDNISILEYKDEKYSLIDKVENKTKTIVKSVKTNLIGSLKKKTESNRKRIEDNIL